MANLRDSLNKMKEQKSDSFRTKINIRIQCKFPFSKFGSDAGRPGPRTQRGVPQGQPKGSLAMPRTEIKHNAAGSESRVYRRDRESIYR